MTLYYELYVAGSVSPLILAKLHMSFSFLVVTLAVGNLIGAFGSLLAGVTDRLGRTNLVVAGLLVTGVITAFILPTATSKWPFTIESFFVGLVEGICLVATPALIRDFSPQAGRATAMGFWTSGPVLGSLIVAVVASHTIGASPSPAFWVHEYKICGIAGLVVFLVALFGMKELSPGLRDQLMVSMRDRALVEARAKGLDIEDALRSPFKQLLKLDVVASALAISVFLLIYYTAVGFSLIYFTTVFGFSVKDGNGLGNWNWGFNVIALIIVGLVSDRLRVRKPLMIVGGVASAIMMVVYLEQAGHHTSYYHLAILLAALSISLGVAYTPWMASFTETVEARNPALTATGLAIWGWILRVTVFVAYMVLPHVVTTVNPLVNYGTTVQTYAAEYGPQIAFAQSHADLITFVQTHPQVVATAQKYATQAADAQKFAPELAAIQKDPATFIGLQSNPTDPTLQAKAVQDLGGGATGVAALQTVAANQAAIQAVVAAAPQLQTLAPYSAQLTQLAANATQLQALQKVPANVFPYLQAHAAAVQKAAKETSGQWKDWYWICFGCILFFLAVVPLMKGRWSPAKAKADEEAHEALVQAELAKLGTTA
ncbi:MFS transporter [Acidiferrimicrobium sp. IK]|uniref:MFS transporter n=1 Tax=Acidiferrimicrobium sp. IK TaxID=2871700 RepID=UPI0021CAE465|nr:MFS transporter [Acidiferrimicrobium sp. IK]MCU4185862.1 MFS transporter [Acidiferrimicrobium sp. IK]